MFDTPTVYLGHEGGAELQEQNYALCRSKAAGGCRADIRTWETSVRPCRRRQYFRAVRGLCVRGSTVISIARVILQDTAPSFILGSVSDLTRPSSLLPVVHGTFSLPRPSGSMCRSIRSSISNQLIPDCDCGRAKHD